MRGRRRWLVAAACVLLAAGATVTVAARLGRADRARPAAPRSAQPLRLAFYYPWFPELWTQHRRRFTRYRPSLGYYDSRSPRVILRHVAAMRYGHVAGGIVSWWGRGTSSDRRLARIIRVSARTGFRWAVYYEPEGQGDPTTAKISSDIAYLRAHYGSRPGYLRVAGRPVVFVYSDSHDGCGMSDRWSAASRGRAFVALKVFPGYRTCRHQPDWWHQYAPANATDDQRGYSFSVSPGLFKATDPGPRLRRSLVRWRRSLRAMARSGEPLQLVTTFNEWGEGTAVESARQWRSRSGYGAYLDALHDAPLGRVRPGLRLRPAVPPAPAPSVARVAPGSSSDPVIDAVGDIACDPRSAPAPDHCRAMAVSDEIIAHKPQAVLTLGDNQYESNTPQQYAGSFNLSFGRFKSLIHPGIGNHEYLTPNAAGYFGYFGAAAGDPTKGYYSFDLGAWHIVSLNSNCSPVGGCDAGSPQAKWLRADLAAHPAACTLAYWHHPRFSSGQHGSTDRMQPIWQILYDAHADLVLSGHDHDYERFAPLNAAGAADPASGIRQFVVGTGGKNHYPIGSPIAGSEVRNDSTFGFLELRLHPRSYDWSFVPEPGKAFTDSGSQNCH